MGHLIYVAALKETFNKTLLTAYLATFLSENHRTILLDGMPQTHFLENFIAKRYHFSLKNNVSLPIPDYHEFKKEKLATQLNQYEFAVTDEPRLSNLKEAEKLFVVLSEDEVSTLTSSGSAFLNAVWEIKKQRAQKEHQTFRCIIILTDITHEETRQKLANDIKFSGFEIAPFSLIAENLKQSLSEGLTLMDQNMPFYNHLMTKENFFARRDFKKLLEYLWSET